MAYESLGSRFCMHGVYLSEKPLRLLSERLGILSVGHDQTKHVSQPWHISVSKVCSMGDLLFFHVHLPLHFDGFRDAYSVARNLQHACFDVGAESYLGKSCRQT